MNLNIKRLEERGSEFSHWYEFINNKCERVIVEISWTNTSKTDKKALPYLWFKNGYTNTIINNYLTVMTYSYDKDGNCYGMYNPMNRRSGAGYVVGYVINFDWLLEATEENEIKLLNEVYRLSNL